MSSVAAYWQLRTEILLGQPIRDALPNGMKPFARTANSPIDYINSKCFHHLFTYLERPNASAPAPSADSPDTVAKVARNGPNERRRKMFEQKATGACQ